MLTLLFFSPIWIAGISLTVLSPGVIFLVVKKPSLVPVAVIVLGLAISLNSIMILVLYAKRVIIIDRTTIQFGWYITNKMRWIMKKWPHTYLDRVRIIKNYHSWYTIEVIAGNQRYLIEVGKKTRVC